MASLGAAVSVLYGRTTSAEEKRQANEWLNAFATTLDAWEASLAHIAPGFELNVQFFAANMLLTKVKKEWRTLSEDQRRGVLAAVRGRLQAALQEETAQAREDARLVRERLAMALTTGAILSGDPSFALADAAQLLSAGNSHCDRYALLMLTTAAESADGLDRAQRQGVCTTLAGAAPEVLGAMCQLVEAPSPRLREHADLVGKCVHRWNGLHPAGDGHTLVHLADFFRTYRPLADFLLASIVAEARENTAPPGCAGGGAAEPCSDALALLIQSSHDSTAVSQQIVASLLAHEAALASGDVG